MYYCSARLPDFPQGWVLPWRKESLEQSAECEAGRMVLSGESRKLRVCFFFALFASFRVFRLFARCAPTPHVRATRKGLA